MRPTPIPDDEIMEGHTRIVMGPPQGHDPTGDIRSVEMLHDPQAGVFRARFVCEADDAERLAAGEPVWFSLWGNGVQPFDLSLAEKN